MKLGFLTGFSEEEVRLAAELGFDGLEVHAGSWDEKDLAAKGKRAQVAKTAKGILDKHGIVITALAHYDFGAKPPKERIERYEILMDFANLLGTGCITTMAAGEQEKSLDENVAIWKKTFGPVATAAQKAGVKIAFENWPGLMSAFPPIKSINFGFNPDAWAKMFDAVPAEVLGLEFDPSHLIWQGMDYLKVAKQFGSRIHHVHAKDTEILDDVLARVGFCSGGWWRYRIPGFGRVNWPAFISVLKEAGYDGGVAIEHEDPVFAGARRVEGLKLGLNHLRPLICA